MQSQRRKLKKVIGKKLRISGGGNSKKNKSRKIRSKKSKHFLAVHKKNKKVAHRIIKRKSSKSSTTIKTRGRKRKRSSRPRKIQKVSRQRIRYTSVSLKKNLLTYRLPKKSFAKKIEYLQGKDFHEVDRFVDKYDDRFPRAFMVVLQTKHGREVFTIANSLSPNTMAVNAENVKLESINKCIDFQDNFFELQSAPKSLFDVDYTWRFDPKNLTAVIIRFFYAQ